MSRIVVFDTNIVLSAIGWKGKPYECVQLARRGVVASVTCRELLEELADKLRAKLIFSDEQTLSVLADLLTFQRVVEISGQLEAVPADPADNKAVECALVGGATHLVTGDRKHLLPMKCFQGIQIVTAAEFLSVALAD